MDTLTLPAIHRERHTETGITESIHLHERCWLPHCKELAMTGLDAFIVSFCVAFVVASARFKAWAAGVSRMIAIKVRR
jgi:hypothetical protein